MNEREHGQIQRLLKAKEAVFSNEELSDSQVDEVAQCIDSNVIPCQVMAAAIFCRAKDGTKRELGVNCLLRLCREVQSNDEFSLSLMWEVLMRLTGPSLLTMYRPEFLSFVIRSSELDSRYGRANVPIILSSYAKRGYREAVSKLHELVSDPDPSVRKNARICLEEFHP